MLKRIIFLFFIFIFSFSLVFSAKFDNKVLAIVGNDSILMSDFDKIAAPIIESYANVLKTPEDKEKLKLVFFARASFITGTIFYEWSNPHTAHDPM